MTDKEFLKAVGIAEFVPHTHVHNAAFLRLVGWRAMPKCWLGFWVSGHIFRALAHLRTCRQCPENPCTDGSRLRGELRKAFSTDNED
jgi:hypothetical protein